MSRSGLFANHENKFKISSKEEIIATASESAGILFEQFESYENSVGMVAAMMITGIKIGVLGDGVINSDEKALIDEIFGEIWNRDMSELYDMIGTEISDNDYDIVKSITNMGNHIAIPFMYFVLSFAYIDGVIEDEVVEKLNNLFEINLAAENIWSALDEEITLTDFEKGVMYCNAAEDAWFYIYDSI